MLCARYDQLYGQHYDVHSGQLNGQHYDVHSNGIGRLRRQQVTVHVERNQRSSSAMTIITSGQLISVDTND